MRAQRALMTRLTHPAFRDVESYLGGRSRAGSHLIRWEIPASEGMRAMFALQQMNITFATLYPDIVGAALDANSHDLWLSGYDAPDQGLPWIAYGRNAPPGALVSVRVAGVFGPSTRVTESGTWTLAVPSNDCSRPTEGARVEFILDGKVTNVAAT